MTDKRNIKHVWVMHQVNCRGAFGSGFAQQIADAFPIAARHYRQHANASMLGHCLISNVAENVHIVHLFGQMNYGNSHKTGEVYTNYAALEDALIDFAKQLNEVIKDNPDEHCIVYPQYMSCGLAGGNPAIVSRIIKDTLGDSVIPKKYINFRKLKEFAKPSENPLTVSNTQEKSNKITDYAIIDHIGSLENEDMVKKAYRLAYSLVPKGRKTYTIKQICLLYNQRIKDMKKMKNAMRMQRHPEQVVLITSNMHSAKWAIRQWTEKVNDITVIHFDSSESFEILKLEDIDPTLTQQWEINNESLRKRRCAEIWGDALGYIFSAPIFPTEPEIAIDMHNRRPNLKDLNDSAIDWKFALDTDWKVESHTRHFDEKEQIWKEEIEYDIDNSPEWKKYRTNIHKPTTRTDKYRRYKAIASDAEIDEFFQFYKFVYANNCIEDFLVEDYSLCPHCGRPVYNKTEDDRCTYCETPNPNNIGEMLRYFDTTETDEDEAY